MSSVDGLEREYSPSCFSKRFSTREEVIRSFVATTNKDSEASRRNYECHLNIAYGPTKREKLDIYGDDLPKCAPLFIFIHGGFWQSIDKEGSAYMVKPLYEKGIRTISIDYELCPNVSLEEIVEQVKKCFKWIGNYVKQNKIVKVGISGHSAGAHLLNYAINEEFMKTITSAVEVHAFYFSGVYYLDELRYLEATNPGGILKITDENCRRLSPQFIDYSYLKNYKFKANVFVSEYESDTFHEHSKKFAEICMKEYLNTFKICEKLDHFDVMERFCESTFEIVQLIVDNLNI